MPIVCAGSTSKRHVERRTPPLAPLEWRWHHRAWGSQVRPAVFAGRAKLIREGGWPEAGPRLGGLAQARLHVAACMYPEPLADFDSRVVAVMATLCGAALHRMGTVG